MPFNISKTIEDMLVAMKGEVKDDWPQIEGYARQIFENEKQALEDLANQRLTGQLTQDEFESELADEKMTVEAELLALKVMGKATVQNAANAAMRVFTKTVETLL